MNDGDGSYFDVLLDNAYRRGYNDGYHRCSTERGARFGELRALMENHPPTAELRSGEWQPRTVGDLVADWIDAVVAAWERGEQ